MSESMSAPTDAPEVPLPLIGDYANEWFDVAKTGIFEGPRYRIHYSSFGSGPPLYLIYGMCCNQRLFAPLALQLAKFFRVVLYDLPGVVHGDEAKLAKYEIDDYSADLGALATHLGHHRFFVIGNSFGGTIAARAMVKLRDRIIKGMLVSSFAHRPLSSMERWILRILRHWPGKLGNVFLMNALTRYNHAKELTYRSPELIDFLLRENGKIPVRTAVYQALAVDATDNRDLLGLIEQPVMIVHGNEDRLVSPSHAGELAQRLVNVQIMLVPECGHMPHLNRPELLSRLAAKFFLELPACAFHNGESICHPMGDSNCESMCGSMSGSMSGSTCTIQDCHSLPGKCLDIAGGCENATEGSEP